MAKQSPRNTPKSPEEVQAEKADRFVRVATRRALAAQGALRSLAKCGNRTIYSPTGPQVDKILDMLSTELHEVTVALEGASQAKAEPDFAL